MCSFLLVLSINSHKLFSKTKNMKVNGIHKWGKSFNVFNTKNQEFKTKCLWLKVVTNTQVNGRLWKSL